MTKLEFLRDKLTQCPICKGYGGFEEAIVCGKGEHYRCDYCDGYGYINPLKKFIYIPLLHGYWRLQEKCILPIKYLFLKIKKEAV